MAAKFIENEILGTSRKCSKDEEKGGMSAGQNSGCERSGERRPDRIPDVRYPEKVERRPDKIPDVRYPEKVEHWPDRIPDVRYPGGMSAGKNSGCETSGWNIGGEEFRV